MKPSDYKISLDILDMQSQYSLPMKKGDTAREIHITLREGGTSYEIGEECFAIFSGKKPDGNPLENNCIIKENTIIYAITPQTTNVSGLVDCEIKLYGAENGLICSPRFSIIVDERVVGDEEIVSTSEFSALTELYSNILTAIEDIGGGSSGMSQTATTLLIEILRNSIYVNDQSENIDNLELELFNHSEPDEPDTPDTPDTPDEPDTPDTPDTPDEPDDSEDVWTYGKYLSYEQKYNLLDDEDWLVTPIIPITTKVELTVQAQYKLERTGGRGVILYYYDSNKTAVDFSSEYNSTVIETINGVDLVEKVMDISKYDFHFVRVNIRKDAYQYCKVWQNGELLFDGSQYPPTK